MFFHCSHHWKKRLFIILTLTIFSLLFFVQTVKASSESVFYHKYTIPDDPYYHSEVFETKHEFDAFAVLGSLDVDLKVKIGDYVRDVEVESEYPGDVSELIMLPMLANSFEIIVENEERIEQDVLFYFFNTKKDEAIEESDLLAETVALSGVKVISRKGWGADESIRFRSDTTESTIRMQETPSNGTSAKVEACNNLIEDYPLEFSYSKVIEYDILSGNKLTWPLQYSDDIKKIVIHHTAENNTEERDPKELMRAIYYYHTVSRGWGDIGYNYVIDREGKIYEGRAGGDGVVGGHTYCYNVGTVGIALMGNFQNDNPTKQQMASLIQLSDILSRKYDIFPLGNDSIHGKVKPNILGHRDLGATACPGENMYDKLDYVRQNAALAGNYEIAEENASNSDYVGKLVSSVDVIDLKPTDSHKISLKFKNTGKKTWNDESWLFVFGNPQTHVAVNGIVPSKTFVAADMKEKYVSPGGTGTFEAELLSGYKEGFYTFEFTPVINGKYKLNHATVVQPFSVGEPKNSYQFVKEKNLPKEVMSGDSFTHWVELKNTGNTTWYSDSGLMFWNAISLGTDHEQDRKSPFLSEDNPSRLGYLKQEKVEPGEIGRFIFKLKAPEKGGFYKEYFRPVINNVEWLEDKNLSFQINVTNPEFRFRLSKLREKNVRMIRGEDKEVTVHIKNIGNFIWEKDKISFKIIKYTRNLKAYDIETGEEIKEINIPEDVAPQEDAVVKFILKASPAAREVNSIKLLPKYNGRNVFKINIPLWVSLEKLKLTAKKKAGLLKTFYRLKPGDTHKVTISFQNTGNIDWVKEGDNYIYLKPKKKDSPYYLQKYWESKTLAARLNESVVKPGEYGTFDLWIGNENSGSYSDSFKLQLHNSKALFMDPVEIRLSVYSSGNSTSSHSSPEEEFVSEPRTPRVSSYVPNTSESIRVKLSFNGDEAVINGDGVFQVTDLERNILFDETTQDVKISLKDNNLQNVGDGKTAVGMRFIPIGDTILEVKNWNHAPGWNPDLNDNRYRGVIELRIENEEIIIINELSLKEYLWGVAEVSNGDPYEKQKVLAILARTYAKFYMQQENRKFPGKPYDASDDPNVFQKYLGYGYEMRSERFKQAVNETEGLVVTYNGELIKTPYFNQSDGRTRSAEEVWGWTHTPYLISVPDPYCEGLEKRGHGVGLSGYGARKAAENGKLYSEIIPYYYQGVEIEKQ